MVAAGPAPGKFTSNRVEQWLFGKLMTASCDGQRSGCTIPREWASKYQLAEVIWIYDVSMMQYTNAS